MLPAADRERITHGEAESRLTGTQFHRDKYSVSAASVRNDQLVAEVEAVRQQLENLHQAVEKTANQIVSSEATTI